MGELPDDNVAEARRWLVLGFDPDALADLNGWVLDGRYAEDHADATETTARRLVDAADVVLGEVACLLG
jgi:hypothetical protein